MSIPLDRGSKEEGGSQGGSEEHGARSGGEAAEQGVSEWIQLLALFSLSLGVVNLLPVPVLDGGHILFYTLEAVRGRPVSREIRERTQMIGVLVLAVVMLLVIVMDIDRWVRSGDG